MAVVSAHDKITARKRQSLSQHHYMSRLFFDSLLDNSFLDNAESLSRPANQKRGKKSSRQSFKHRLPYQSHKGPQRCMQSLSCACKRSRDRREPFRSLQDDEDVRNKVASFRRQERPSAGALSKRLKMALLAQVCQGSLAQFYGRVHLPTCGCSL